MLPYSLLALNFTSLNIVKIKSFFSAGDCFFVFLNLSRSPDSVNKQAIRDFQDEFIVYTESRWNCFKYEGAGRPALPVEQQASSSY